MDTRPILGATASLGWFGRANRMCTALLAGLMLTAAAPALALTPVQVAKLIAGDQAAEDWFGWSVAVSENTAVIGSPQDDDNGTDSGSAYVFVESGSGWVQQAKLTPSDAKPYYNFGFSVAIDGDTVVVGTELLERGPPYTLVQAAYVFVRNGDSWTQQARLVSDITTYMDMFGNSVSIDGDTIVVGAPFDRDRATTAGAAHVFVRSGANWARQAKLTDVNGQSSDRFGQSVAVDGDTVLIGAYMDDEAGEDSGSAFVFHRSAGNWIQQAKLVASDGGTFGYFGEVVALSGDTALVGARLDDYQKGAAYFFERSGGSWGQSYKATADNATTGQQFGTAVALDGQTAAIYALGQLHLLERSVDGNWGQSAKLPAYAGSSGVWIDGETILAGAFTDSETFIRAGAAFVFQSETPANDAPVAIAGSDVAIRAGDNVCLDGGSSFDDNTDSGALQYAWTFSYRPSTSSAELIGADTATPCFTADVADTFSLQLVVSDGQGLSSVPDFLEVGANNLPPTAVAGLDQLVVTGTVVALNGSNSTDPENESLTYSWTLDVAPPGSAAVLSGAETATASFTADQEGAYEIALSVSDALGPGESDFLTVVAASPTEFASIQIIEINEIVVVLPPDAFPSPGLQNPIINLLMQAERALQRGDIATAIEKLQSALNRTDGCVLRGEPDADGEGRDWITDCTAQEQIYFLLETTLDALTP